MSVSQIGSLCFIHKSIRGSGGPLFLRPRQPRPEESQPHQRLPTLRLWVPAASCPPCRLKPFWDFCAPVLLRLVRHLIFDNRNCDVLFPAFLRYILCVAAGCIFCGMEMSNQGAQAWQLCARRARGPVGQFQVRSRKKCVLLR